MGRDDPLVAPDNLIWETRRCPFLFYLSYSVVVSAPLVRVKMQDKDIHDFTTWPNLQLFAVEIPPNALERYG